MNAPNATRVAFVSDKDVDDHYEETVVNEDVRARSAARLDEIGLRLKANQVVTIGSAVVTVEAVQGAVITTTNVTREAIQRFGWARVQADPHAPAIDLLKMRPDIY